MRTVLMIVMQNAENCYAELTIYSPAMATTINCQYSLCLACRDGQAELAWWTHSSAENKRLSNWLKHRAI